MRKLTLVILLLLASASAFADGGGLPPIQPSSTATVVWSAIWTWLLAVR